MAVTVATVETILYELDLSGRGDNGSPSFQDGYFEGLMAVAQRFGYNGYGCDYKAHKCSHKDEDYKRGYNLAIEDAFSYIEFSDALRNILLLR